MRSNTKLRLAVENAENLRCKSHAPVGITNSMGKLLLSMHGRDRVHACMRVFVIIHSSVHTCSIDPPNSTPLPHTPGRRTSLSLRCRASELSYQCSVCVRVGPWLSAPVARALRTGALPCRSCRSCRRNSAPSRRLIRDGCRGRSQLPSALSIRQSQSPRAFRAFRACAGAERASTRLVSLGGCVRVRRVRVNVCECVCVYVLVRERV